MCLKSGIQNKKNKQVIFVFHCRIHPLMKGFT